MLVVMATLRPVGAVALVVTCDGPWEQGGVGAWSRP